jgi:hypothetical protein
MCTMVGNLSTRQSTEVFKTRHNPQETGVSIFDLTMPNFMGGSGFVALGLWLRAPVTLMRETN